MRAKLAATVLWALVVPLPAALAGAITLDEATARSFDYVIIGGGLGGLVVAGRLSEDPSVSVLVIEAGADRRDDPAITDPAQYGAVWDDSKDLAWKWDTVEGQTIYGGRVLGGSTSINGMAYTRPSSSEFQPLLDDSVASHLHGSRWTWSSMFTAMKKSESFRIPSPEQTSSGASYNADYHGFSGPVSVGYTSLSGNAGDAYLSSASAFVDRVPDADGGHADTSAQHPMTVDGQGKRSASTAYYSPVQDRPNLSLLTDTRVTKIRTACQGSTLRATGVEIGDRFVAAGREVILAAGAIASPMLLQLSGIGPAKVLQSAGVQVNIDLPGVGANLQEQTMNFMTWEKKDATGPTGFAIVYPNASALFPDDPAGFKTRLSDAVSAAAEAGVQNGGFISAEAGREILNHQVEIMQTAGLAELSMTLNDNDGTVGANVWALRPLSRGSVQITSGDAGAKPRVTVGYFSTPLDAQIQSSALSLTRKIFSTPPLSSLVGPEISPSAQISTSADLETWAQSNFVTVAHPVGTCAMLPLHLGGVVDASLTVYGTSNLRVVDASVLSFQVSAHLMGVLYGVAEVAGDIIKSGQK